MANLSIGKTVITKALAGRKSVKGMVYFLHGACDDGFGLQSWVNKTINGNFAFKYFPVVYPSSPVRSYSLHDGKKECIWFDQLALNPNYPEDYGTINAVSQQLAKFIREGESRTGVPQENVIIGGFSMGGAMAIHLGYKLNSNVAGVFALSSFLPHDSRLYEDMEVRVAMNSPSIRHGEGESTDIEHAIENVKFPKLFMSHGQKDPIVSLKWAKNTFHELRRRGVDGQFYTMPNIEHTVCKQQLGLLHEWIDDTLYSRITAEN